MSRSPATFLMILAGPAGSGKTTLCERMVSEVPGLERVITATTRPPREGEQNGRDYHFLSEEEFTQRIEAGDFIEWAQVHRRYRYGTLKSTVLDKLAHTNLIMNIDVQGVQNFGRAAAENTALHGRFVTIFIEPPSLEELRSRLKTRGKDDEVEILHRLRTAELELLEQHHFNYILRSRSKEEDFAALYAIWDGERSKRMIRR